MFRKFKQKNLIESAIRGAATKHKITIHTILVMSEHVHLLGSLPHNITESKALMLLKGGSAHIFFKNHEKSRLRLLRGHLWSARRMRNNSRIQRIQHSRQIHQEPRATSRSSLNGYPDL